MIRRRRRSAGQTLVEFALVAPVFLLVVLASIDFAGYFGSRLSIENATREGVRYAITQACDWSSSTSACGNTTSWSASSSPPTSSIEGVIRAAASYPVTIPNADCSWSGGSPGSGTASVPAGDAGCMSIVYFNIQDTAETKCAWWSASSGWNWVNIANYGPTGSGAAEPCVAPGSLVQVTVMWRYSPLTPLPALPSSALTTTATIQLTEED